MSRFELSDVQLVQRVLEGEHPAFRAVVEKYYDRLYAIAYGHLLDHEEAADLVQDVFIRAYEKLDTLRHWERLGPFLARIAKNLSLNKLKSRKRFRAARDRMEYQLTVEEQIAAQELSEAERNDLHAVLRALVKTLPASSREVVLLHYFEEMSTPEIAEFLGIRQPAVLQRLHYGRKLLRTRMEHELKPALENDEQRRKHIHAIVAAIPFGKAPWAGSPVPVRPVSAAQSRRIAAVKVGAAGGGLIAAAGLVVWFALLSIIQPNPSVQSITTNSVPAAMKTSNAVPGLSDSTLAPRVPERTTTAALESGATKGAAVSAGAPEELVFGPPPWELAPSQRSALQTLVTIYNSQNPRVPVRLAPDRAKLDSFHVKPEHVGDIILDETLGAGGSAVLARLRELDAVVPLGSEMDGATALIEDYYSNVQDLVRADGEVWGIPFFTVSWAFALPSGLEEEAWVAQYLRSWEQFPDLLSALWLEETEDGRGRASVAMLNPKVMWSCLFLRAGGDLNDLATLQADSGPATASLARFSELFKRNQPAFHPPGMEYSDTHSEPSDCFRVVTDLLPDEHSLVSVRDLDPAVTLLPAPGSGAIPSVFSHVLAIKKSTPEREQAAWDFIQWLVSDDMLRTLYREQGILPLRKSLAHIVTTEDGKLLLEQIKRMQFQRPQRECIAAYDSLRKSFVENLRYQCKMHLRDEVAAVR